MPEFRLPDLGEGVTEGEVVEWRVAEGGAVARDQILVVVGTDKATVEIPSPFQGEVEEILAKEGERVEVGQALIRVRSAGEPAVERAAVEVAPSDSGPLQPSPAAVAPPAGPDTHEPPPRVLALPAVRRVARERGIALPDVPGSGPGGRVRMGDLAAPGRRAPLRGTRRAMAQRMAEAHRRVPQVTVVLECDLQPVEELARPHALDSPRSASGSILGLVALAAVAGIRAEPLFNTSFDEDSMELEFHDSIHLGIAVQTSDGLKVATLKDADHLAPAEFQLRLGRLVAAAREGTLSPAELQGSTFTISSAGRLGGLFATPIVNWPNVAVLGLHAIQDRPVVRAGQVVVGRMANLSLSFDHRVIDGLTASAFLYQLADRLANPTALLG